MVRRGDAVLKVLAEKIDRLSWCNLIVVCTLTAASLVYGFVVAPDLPGFGGYVVPPAITIGWCLVLSKRSNRVVARLGYMLIIPATMFSGVLIGCVCSSLI